MSIEISINDNWGTFEAEVRIYGEERIVNILEDKIKNFKKGNDYSINDEKEKRTFTILSNDLKKSIWEIEGIGYPSPSFRNSTEGIKLGNVIVEIINEENKSIVPNSSFGVDFVHDQFIRDREVEVRRGSDFLKTNDSEFGKLESEVERKNKELDEARKRLNDYKNQGELKNNQEHYPFGSK